MQLSDVEEVMQANIAEVNQALAEGWKLVAVTQGPGQPVYVLGRSKYSVLQQAVANAKVIQPVNE